MIINFTLSVLGFAIAMRTFQRSAEEFAFSVRVSAAILVFLMVMILCALLFLHTWPFALWIFIGIILISLNLFPYFLRIFLIRSMKRQLIPLLDQVILGLQTGSSFRIALRSAIEAQQSWFRRQLLDIYNAVVNSREQKSAPRTKFFEELIAEFSEIDRSQNKIVEQVRAFRRQLKTEEDFRRRSGQVTQQIRLQAIIVTVMFVALLLFVSFNFGFFKNIRLILFASGLFAGGVVWIFMMGRGMKWKI
jgi:hypothetical protein